MKDIVKFRFLGIAAFLAMLAGFSAAVMYLWNTLMPQVFGLGALNYWQAAGLLLLARILFGGMGGARHFGAPGGRGGFGGFRHGNPFRERWMKMNEEERRDFLRFSHHHAFFGGNPENWMNMNEDERRKFMRPFFGENENPREKSAGGGEGGKSE